MGGYNIPLGKDQHSWRFCNFDRLVMQVMDNGLNSSIMTFYEITNGDLSHTSGKPICCLVLSVFHFPNN